jgi:DNA-binding beta-propeller fold protein YncE
MAIRKIDSQSGIFSPRGLVALSLWCAGAAAISLAAIPTAPRNSQATQSSAQASVPGSTCQNSANPLASGCETWLARYAHPGSSDDKPAALAISPDGSHVFVTGDSGHLQTVNDFATTAYDTATGQQLWVATYNGPGNDVDQASAIAISPDGTRVYVTGRSVGANVGNSGPSYEYATIAYDTLTGAQQWVSRFNGLANPGLPASSGSAEPAALGVSPDGTRIFVTGMSAGALGPQYATVAYDSSGNQLWSSTYNGTASSYNVAKSISISPDGAHVYVTGTSQGATTKYDYATVAYDATSGVQLWAARYDGPSSSYDQASSVTTGPDGSRVYVTGQSTDSNGYPDYATVAYDSGTGSQLWVSRYVGPGNAYNLAAIVRVSPNGRSVFVTGENVTFVDQQHSISEYPTVAYDAATGTQQWVSTYPGPKDDAYVAVSLALSSDGKSVYVIQMSGENGGDFATVDYDANTGAQQWIAKYNGPANDLDLPKAIGVSKDGSRVIVTGVSPGINTRNDFATLSYDASTGTQEWVTRYNAVGVNDDEAVAIAASPDSNTVYVTGWSENGGSSGLDYATAAYDAATGTQKWLSRYHRTDHSFEIVRAMAVSHDGRQVYVTGYTDAGFNGAPSEYTTIAYNAASGAELWVDFFTAPTNSDINLGTAQALAVSPDDSRIYITGNVSGSTGGLTSYDQFGTVALDAASGSVVWSAFYSGNAAVGLGSNIAWAIGVTPDGKHVIVAGQSSNTGSPADFGTVAYDGATGAQQWIATYNGPGNNFDAVRAIAVSPDSSAVYVTGESFGLNNAYAYSTIAYDVMTGSQKWQATYTGPGGTGDLPAAIAASPDGKRVYVTGASDGTATGTDYGTVAYDAASGSQVWVARYAQPGSDLGAAIAVSPDSSLVFVTGESAGATTHGDYATIFYDATSGSEKLAARYDGPIGADDLAAKIAVSPDGARVFVTGVSPGTGTGPDYATIAYDTALIGAGPVQLSGVLSRKVHGSAGVFDINLPTTGSPGIECRSGGSNGDHTIIFTFSNTLTGVGGASVTSGTGNVHDGAIGSDAHDYIVNVTGVTNAQTITVTLTHVTDSSGNSSSAVSASMGVLLGDVNASGRVDAADVALVRQQTLQSITSANFREDIDITGRIDAADVSMVRQQSLTSLR